MKKTLKKVLILFAIVTVIVTVCAFATSAAADCGAGNHTVYQIAHEPTCTDPGYIEYRCTMCNTYYEAQHPLSATSMLQTIMFMR